jgi:hypothetical protein
VQKSLKIPSLIRVLLVVVVILAVLLQEAVQLALAAGLVNDEVVVLLVIVKSGFIVGLRLKLRTNLVMRSQAAWPEGAYFEKLITNGSEIQEQFKSI